MRVIKVNNKRNFIRFINVPDLLFANEPCYVPPLRSGEKKGYDKKNNHILAKSDYELLLLLDDNEKPAGRVLVYVDHAYNEYHECNAGTFGSFECIDDARAGKLLTDEIERILKDKGVDFIIGPINPIAENWGFLYKGFEHMPVYLAPWNPEYYNDFFVSAGFVKARDLFAYQAHIGVDYILPERYKNFPEKFYKKNPDVTIRKLDMKNIEGDANYIWELSNVSLSSNWGYVLTDPDVLQDMIKKLRIIVDPDSVLIAFYKDRAIGYCLGFPDINKIVKRINGRLFPFGWAVLLLNLKKIKDYRLFGLAVHPDWHRKALDALMYITLHNNLFDKKIRMEANYIQEDNAPIKNALEKLGMEHIITYRVYEKILTTG